MKYFLPVLTTLFLLNTSLVVGQQTNQLESINKDVWQKFYLAFDSLDHSLMADIHSKDLARITANNKQIKNYSEYIEGYKSSFKKSKLNNRTTQISLRFFERISNEFTASERGIYRTIQNKGKSDERRSYGQFFVLLKKENGIWKIILDYDSNENKTIDKDDYLKAYAIDDFDKFK